MCGRVIVKTTIANLMRNFSFAAPGDDGELEKIPLRFNGAPSQIYPIIVYEADIEGPAFIAAKWGFIPRWMKDEDGGPKPINAKSETVRSNGMFKYAYKSRRALMPVDGYFEWKAIKGEKTKQPYAIAMKSGKPFALAAIYERWRSPRADVDITTFCVLTCPPNEMMAEIHDRMPVILHEKDYMRWLSDVEDDPYDLLVPYPSDDMTMWPVSTKVNSPRNNEPDILDPLE